MSKRANQDDQGDHGIDRNYCSSVGNANDGQKSPLIQSVHFDMVCLIPVNFLIATIQHKHLVKKSFPLSLFLISLIHLRSYSFVFHFPKHLQVMVVIDLDHHF